MRSSAPKKKRAGDGFAGRVDLYVGACIKNDYRSISLEAKHSWASTPKTIVSTLSPYKSGSKLKQAIEAAKELRKFGDARCAVVFVCPHIVMDRKFNEKYDNISDAFWSACESLGNKKVWAAFSVSDRDSKTFILPHEDGKKYSYPAIGVLFLKVK